MCEHNQNYAPNYVTLRVETQPKILCMHLYVETYHISEMHKRYKSRLREIYCVILCAAYRCAIYRILHLYVKYAACTYKVLLILHI